MSEVRTRVVVLCATCGVHWDEGVEAAACGEAGHEHQRFEVHVHRDVVTLPDGTEVTAVSFDAADPYARDRSPDHGLYLDARWAPPWSHELIDWPDFGVPGDPAGFVGRLGDVLARARRGERVEVGCLGGHGRTGTAIAALAVLTGHPAGDAVAWARDHYCAHAVETPEQEALVAGLSGRSGLPGVGG
jgi:hypothetical protein